jgi:hypothetical protein
MTSPDDLADVRERVRARYTGAAATVLTGGTPRCGESCAGEDEAGTGQYSDTEQAQVPEQAVADHRGSWYLYTYRGTMGVWRSISRIQRPNAWPARLRP